MKPHIRPAVHTNQIVEKCVAHLDREISLFSRFIEVSQSIQNVVGIHAGAPDAALDEITQSLKQQAGTVAESRQRLQLELSQYLGLTGGRASVKQLIDQLSGQQAEMIATRRTKLLEMESQIRSMNRTNTLILQQSLDLYERIVVGLTGQAVAPPTYSSSGEIGSSSGANLLQTEC